MKTVKLYVAGGMSGIKDLNFPAFHAETARLRALGFDVINPAEINNENPADALTMTPEQLISHWRKCMRADITKLMECDGIVMLDGWTASKGATLEHHNAYHLGMHIFSAGTLTAYSEAICHQ